MDKMKIDLRGTLWYCIEPSMKEFDMSCTVIEGVVYTDINGNTPILIEFEDGTKKSILYKHFIKKFKRIFQ